MNARTPRVVPLPKDATAEQIVELCAATADLVAFKAALRWLAPEDWAPARSQLERALLETVELVRRPDSLADERDARGRLAARFHKMQLLKAEDVARRGSDRDARRAVPGRPAEAEH